VWLLFLFQWTFAITAVLPAALTPQNTKSPPPIFKNPDDRNKQNGNLNVDYRGDGKGYR